MPHAQTKRDPLVRGKSQIRAFQRIGVSIVGAGASGIELIAEDVVVEAAARAGQRRVAVFRTVIARVRTEAIPGVGVLPVRVQTWTTLVIASEP